MIVIQLGSHPAQNRGARANLLTIHERLQARGHESLVIDLTRNRQVKMAGVHSPRTAASAARLLTRRRADVAHLHVGSALTWRKLALAGIVNALPAVKTVCTLHLGGHFYPKQGLQARRWGATRLVMRQFDALIAISPEVANFYEHIGARPNQVRLITPFPRLRLSRAVTFTSEIEDFCRCHTPLILSAGFFEPGSNVPLQFDILSEVRERYPSAGLIAVGEGSLHFRYQYERALHREANHIAFPGAVSRAELSELIRRAAVFLRTDYATGEPHSLHEAQRACMPLVFANRGAEEAALQTLCGFQVKRAPDEDVTPALSDGVDDVIRLYKQISASPEPTADMPSDSSYEWPMIGWGL